MTTTDHAAETPRRPPMDAERIAEIRARVDAATDDTGLIYDMRADEWQVSTDKSTALTLTHAVRDLRDLLAEVERLRADVPLTLVSAGRHTRGGFGLTFGAGTVAAQDVLVLIADAMRAWFTDNGGINYVEATLRDSDGREWVMTVAPGGKPTPHQLRQRAEAEVERLTAERDALAETVERVRALHSRDPAFPTRAICAHCYRLLPCPTVRALDGEEA